MQASLDAQGTLHIPACEKPYYLDGPLVLKSGQKLSADPTAEIRLKPGSNTCMARNEPVLTLNTKPVHADQQVDTDITIKGGIWTTLATAVASNDNERGRSSKENPAFGAHGVILLQNVCRQTTSISRTAPASTASPIRKAGSAFGSLPHAP